MPAESKRRARLFSGKMVRFLLAAVAASAATAQIRFEDVGQKAGLQFELKNSAAAGRYHQIELMVGGVAAFDYDNDGCPDLYFANGADIPTLRKTGPEYHNRLYRGDCHWKFTDVTARAGVAGEGYSMAVATADYDNDGFTDIFVAGVNRNILYRNLGDGRFQDVTARARLTGVDPKYGKMWAVSAGWLDYDNDGRLDLFVSNYVVWDPASEPACGPPDARFYCHPNAYRGLPNQLFRNNGDGTFTDVSLESGIGAHIGKGMGVAFGDLDLDGRTDIYVANDSVRSFLFRNRGDGSFLEFGLEAGVALREDGASIAGMGVDFRDFDNDGLPDIVVSGMINDSFLLFRNLGKRTLFEDFGQQSGLTLATRQLTGWSLGLEDLDNDGWKDLFFALSHFPRLERWLGRSAELTCRVFRNQDGKRFEDVTGAAGPDMQKAALHHGAAFADFDGDGRLDAAVSVLNGPARLYRNVSPDARQWIALKLVGKRASRQGLGAAVSLTLPDGRVLHNAATTSVGYACSSEPLVRFGLAGHPTAKRIEIRWPGGGAQQLENIQGGRVVEVVQTPP